MNKLICRMGALVLLTWIANAVASAAPLTAITVGSYAPNPNAHPISDVASNSLAGGITLANFQTSVAAAFAADQGGVIDFENANNWVDFALSGNGAANPITAIIGSSQSRSIRYWRTDVDSMGVPHGIDSNSNNGPLVVSGTNYMGVNGIPAPLNLSFETGLKQLGLTFVPRFFGARSVTMTATLTDASTIVSSTVSLAELTPAAYFFGFDAPAGQRIVGLEIDAVDTLTGFGAFTRFDDFGFVIPEPASLSLIGLASFGLLDLRRRHKAHLTK